MQSNRRSGGEPLGVAAGADDLTALLAAVGDAERAMARAVVLAGRVVRSGVCEAVEGLPVELWLGLAGRLVGADRYTLVTAAGVLDDMPYTAGAFQAGGLSWGQVRTIAKHARRMCAEDRGVLDRRVEAAVAGGFGDDPDALVEAVAAAADDLKTWRAVQRREQRRRDSNVFMVQPSLDGGVTGWFDFDPLAGAAVVNALDHAAGLPVKDDTDSDEPGTTRARQYAHALERICAEWLGGTGTGTGAGGGRRRAKPLLVAHVDVADLTGTTAGTVELGVRGGLPRLTARAIEAIAKDADVQAVVFDGKRPLAVTGKLKAKAIPADVRLAVQARDKGCRWPGCNAPVSHTDIHHIRYQSNGGLHDPDNLICLCRHHHDTTHKHGWTVTLDPHTGEALFKRGKQVWRSRPRGTPLPQPPPNPEPDPGDGEDEGPEPLRF